MTNEQLLIPRVKVIALWPGCQYTIGDILEKRDGFYLGYEITMPYYEYAISPDEVEPNTANFRKLPWYEDRNIEDLPEYVKGTYLIFKKDIKIVNVDWVKIKGYLSIKNKLLPGWHRAEHYDLLPATESEYLEYLKSKQ